MSPDQSQRSRNGPPLSEWIVAGLSLLLVLAAAAYLAYDAVSASERSPEVEVAVDSVVKGRGAYIMRVTARNRGGATAANVQVSAELRTPGDSVAERSTVTIAFIPASSSRQAGVFFTLDPRSYRLRVRAEGFSTP